MKRCVYLTMENPEGFFIYDELTFAPLKELDWQIIEIPWTHTNVQWSDYDAIVIRSPWDYQTQPDRFLSVLAEIEASGTRLFNPLATCRWNMTKTYLRDLEQRGVAIVPTIWLDRLDSMMLMELFIRTTSRTIVVKPIIGAGAEDTFVLRHDHSFGAADALRVFADRPLQAQPFLESIVTEGEYSLFYFENQYSHAIIKCPKAGDFRVQEEHGGLIAAFDPDNHMREVGQKVIDAIGETLLYARIDLVRLPSGELALIEAELIEPSLYFPYDAESPRRFAEALDRMARN